MANKQLPSYVLWYFNDTLLTFIHSSKYKQQIFTRQRGLVAELRVHDAQQNDSGWYKCKADNSPPKSMPVYVNGTCTSTFFCSDRDGNVSSM
ncbi:unnamed protein product [Soboliphyme baturini]|uniref:Ig-like domain-containing protein n=1 Tax=Soboliphyme baturini TaxID=241478 RepID=A0A183IL53_9BILA|nr:unnamed protein product [Soboliphyme baturini]